MTDKTTRRALLGAIAATPIVAAVATSPATATTHTPDPRWNRRVARYRRARALMEADYAFGDNAKANEAFNTARAEAVRAVGEGRLDEHPGFPEAWEAMSRADEERFRRYIRPADLAAMLVVLTPAPNLEAALLKVEIIKEHELDNYSPMPRDPFGIVLEDMRRLAREG